MRAALVVVILSLASTALAEGVFVFALPDGEARDRVLDTMVARKQLEARARASFPTQKQAVRELAKLPISKTRTRKPINAATCRLVSSTGDLQFECEEPGCAGSCQVIRNGTTIRVRNGTWSVIATNVKRLGDTGECGCCM